MPWEEGYRRDLFEVTRALVRRVELDIDDRIVVAGQIRDGKWRIFIGQEFSLLFGTDHQLRRVFHEGLLYRAEKGRQLAVIRRTRDEGRPVFRTRLLSETEKAALLDHVRHELEVLSDHLVRQRYRCLRAIPSHEAQAILDDLCHNLGELVESPILVADGMRAETEDDFAPAPAS